jgi:bla regulator protein blaR1
MNAPLWFSNLAAYWLQVGALVLAASVLAAVSRLAAPRLLHAYWRGVLAACLVLPLVQPWRPLETGAVTLIGLTPQGLGAPAAAPRWAWFQAAPWILVVLIAGAVLRFAWLALGFAQLRRFRRAALPFVKLPDGVREIQSRLGLAPVFRLSEEIHGPVTFGLRAPAILLPARFSGMEAEHQRAIVAHELFHVARRDWAFHVAEEAVLAGFWYHPAVWWVVSRIRLSREQVVDQQVVELTGARKPYLCALLEFATGARHHGGLTAPAFLDESRLAERIRVLVKEEVMSKRKRALALGVLVALTLIAGLVSVRVFPLRAAGAPAAEESRTAGHPPMKILKKVQPIYPAVAKKAGLEGVVTLSVTVLKDGSVSNMQVIKGDPVLAKSALDAVRQWQFAPLDKPSAVTKIEISFSLEDATKPVPTYQPTPVYTPEAKAAKTQGTVILGVTVEADGTAGDVKVIRGLDKGLDQAAVDAVKTWKFKPATKAGKPIPAKMTIETTFKLT